MTRRLRCFICHARSMPAPGQRSQGYRRQPRATYQPCISTLQAIQSGTDPRHDILLKTLNLEDTPECSAPSRLRRGVIFSPAVLLNTISCSSAGLQDGGRYWPWVNHDRVRSSSCQHGMGTSPDLTVNANRRSLDGNSPWNCWSA
jgi:hypothetical protein